MPTLDDKITSWLQRNAGVVCSTTFTNMGLNPWRCEVHTSELVLARATGVDELTARRNAFQVIFARSGAPRSHGG